MTTRSRDQAAARSLAVLTGAPYQSCLAAVPVLRRLPRGTEREELEEVLAGGEPFRHLTFRFTEREDVEEILAPSFGPWVHPRSEVLFQDVNHEELLFFTTVAPPDTELPGNVMMSAQDVYFTGLPRPGVWRTGLRAWTRACRAVLGTDTDDWSVDFSACRTDPSLVPPRDPIHLGFGNEGLWTMEPEEAIPGPGFAWLRLPLATLDVDTSTLGYAIRRDRLSGDQDRGSAMPSASPDEVFVPDILFRAWREVGASIHPADEWARRSKWHEWNGGEEGPSWFGLDLPDYTVLWLRVVAQGRPEVAPSVL